jgi:hypothetical protein
VATHRQTVDALLHRAGQTFAHEAGIHLADTPAPLYRLLVLSVLLSTRIKADIAVAAARELFAAGCGTPRGMLNATWQDRVDALGRGHYVRYDESTASALGDGAQLLLDEYRGDLRRLRDRAADTDELRELLREVPRLGPVGVDIFCREAQQVWPRLRPYLDRKALDGAGKLGLPTDPAALARLVTDHDLAVLAAALVRVSLRPSLTREL